MKETRLLMGMPITVEVIDDWVSTVDFDSVFAYFQYIDNKFSPYKETSELALVNAGKLAEVEYSEDMKTVLKLSAQTKRETNGYFDIGTYGAYDTSGLVKGWAIYNAALLLRERGFRNFYVDAGGDIQVMGLNLEGQKWRLGLQNPFNQEQIVKIVSLSDQGLATSGTYIRGQHIYNPYAKEEPITDIVSLSVIGPNVYEADRFATAAFAMGREGIEFIEKTNGLEGYMIDKDGVGYMTSGFGKYAQ